MRTGLDSGRYTPTADYDDCRDFDFAVISVPTPLREGVPDLSYITSSAISLAPHLRQGATVITFRQVNIALVNELAIFASDMDVDAWAAIDAATTKPFGYIRFTPGPGNTSDARETPRPASPSSCSNAARTLLLRTRTSSATPSPSRADHDQLDFDLVAAEADWVLDCRNVLPAGDNVERL